MHSLSPSKLAADNYNDESVHVEDNLSILLLDGWVTFGFRKKEEFLVFCIEVAPQLKTLVWTVTSVQEGVLILLFLWLMYATFIQDCATSSVYF